MHPLLILTVGIASVLGLILVLRVHAFLALIVSAILVSLLAPGPVEVRIQRVADAFGASAASIAIVIALAAIVGECMMASGAADRIVQAFLRLLGEKRSPVALMGSGFVLAVPVFFDTVFYLLVPLARSLFRRTRKNYLLYILAIAAGGAITHTLVPPTPGPLVMASTLGIDIGVMMLVGGMVALPAALAALVAARWFDATMDVPYRNDKMIPLEEGEEDEEGAPAVQSSPPLWLSLLPVLLPVLLISANTALSTAANSEHAAHLSPEDFRDWPRFRSELAEADEASPGGRVAALLPSTVQARLDRPGPLTEGERLQVVASLNELLGRKRPPLYEPEAFQQVVRPRWEIEQDLAVSGAAAEERRQLERELALGEMLEQDPPAMPAHQRERFHRTLLEVAFPDLIAPHRWETPLRQAANVAALFGNANLALLLSAIVAMLLLYRQHGLTLLELSRTAERSLMSGGTIILITAGGGAFGAMLQTARIGPAIEQIFTGGSAAGLMFLFMGYGVAALLKVAQGSSTVAMITASGILAAMVGGTDLTFHPVYLATAIGAGSLMGSWMNDSGFWIFTKMGRLTEMEGLLSWTRMLMVLSVVSFGTTLILATVLPLN